MLRRTLKTLSIFVAFIGAWLASTGVAFATECTPFGCHPGQGNPFEELAGQIVMGIFLVALLLGGARRYVK